MKQSEFLHALREECGSEPVPPVIHRAVVNACAALPERQGRRPIHWFAWAPKLAVGLLCVAAFAGFSAMLLLNLSLPAEDPHNSRLSSSQTSELPEVKPSASPLPVPTEAELRPLIEERLKKALTLYYRNPIQVDSLLKHLINPQELMLENVFDWDAIDSEYQDQLQNDAQNLIFTNLLAFFQRIKCIVAVKSAVRQISEDPNVLLSVDAGIAEFGIDAIRDITDDSCTVDCRLTAISGEIWISEGGSFRVRFPYQEIQCSVVMKLEDGLWKVDKITETTNADVFDNFYSYASLEEALEYIQSSIKKDIAIVIGLKEPPLPEGPRAQQNGFTISHLTCLSRPEQSDLEVSFAVRPQCSEKGCSYALFREDGKTEWYIGGSDPENYGHGESVNLCPDDSAKQIIFRIYKNQSESRLDIDPGEIVAEFTIDLETQTISTSETWKDKKSPLFYDREAYLKQTWYCPSYSTIEYDPELPVQVLYATNSPYYASYSGDCLVALAFAPGVFREIDLRAEREDGSSGFSETIGTGRSVKLDHFTLEEYDRRLKQIDLERAEAHDCVTGPYLLADDFPEGTEFCVAELSFASLKVGHPLIDGETITLRFQDPEDYHQILYETSFTIALPEIGLQENEQLVRVCTNRYQPYIVVPKE